MDLTGWNHRYQSENSFAAPTALVVEIAGRLTSGKALDLACGSGRNAIWLAQHGWEVTAVDGAESAIEQLQERSNELGLAIQTAVADLQSREYRVAENAWDLICICYYLQRDLFAPALAGLRSGGTLLVIVHTAENGEEPTAHRLRPGELKSFFNGTRIVHYREGKPDDAAHKRAVAEIVVQRA